MSCQNCGCDPEARPPHICERHEREAMLNQFSNSTSIIPGIPVIGSGALGCAVPFDHFSVGPTKTTTPANPVIGPIRASTFPNSAQGRKERPVASGVLDYFPDAIVAVARVSHQGNEQHNPGQPLHWAREKSTDEADALLRHFLQRGSLDDDGQPHSAKMAWRALALLQKEIERGQ